MYCLWCAYTKDNKFKETASGEGLIYNPLVAGGAPWYARWFGILFAETQMCHDHNEDDIVYKKHHLVTYYSFLGKQYMHEVY